MSDRRVPPLSPDAGRVDLPTVALTPDEQKAFEEITRQLGGRRRVVGLAVMAAPRSPATVGVLLLAVGTVWMLAWLAVNVPLSFVGVLVQFSGAVCLCRVLSLHRTSGLAQAQ